MKLLPRLVKQTASADRTVERAKVAGIREGRARLSLNRGEAWARCGITVSVGQWVTAARVGGEFQVLALAAGPRKTVKRVRV